MPYRALPCLAMPYRDPQGGSAGLGKARLGLARLGWARLDSASGLVRLGARLRHRRGRSVPLGAAASGAAAAIHCHWQPPREAALLNGGESRSRCPAL